MRFQVYNRVSKLTTILTVLLFIVHKLHNAPPVQTENRLRMSIQPQNDKPPKTHKFLH